MLLCPCSSGANYSDCCKPFHDGNMPKTALQLMRSRFSAYALSKAEYIIETTHPANPQYQENKPTWKKSILQFSKGFSFRKLDVLDFKEKNNIATVTFVAHISEGEKDATFTERSLFEKIGKHWLYKGGVKENGHAPQLVTPGDLSILSLAYYGDPILRKKAEPILEINNEIRELVAQMVETMDAYNGIGIAAPQVHRSIRLFIIRKPHIENDLMKFGEVQVFINPVLSLPSKESWEASEGCLSIPSIRSSVQRPLEITVEYTDLNNDRITARFSGWHAKMIMHENDHIQGILFIDRLSSKEKLFLETELKKLKERIYKK